MSMQGSERLLSQIEFRPSGLIDTVDVSFSDIEVVEEQLRDEMVGNDGGSRCMYRQLPEKNNAQVDPAAALLEGDVHEISLLISALHKSIKVPRKQGYWNYIRRLFADSGWIRLASKQYVLDGIGQRFDFPVRFFTYVLV